MKLVAALAVGLLGMPLQSVAQDRFNYDPAAYQRRVMMQRDTAKMADCVETYTRDLLSERSRLAIKARMRSMCVADLVADGLMTNKAAGALCDAMVDREITALVG